MYDDGGLSGGTRVGALADQQAFPLRFHTSNGNNEVASQRTGPGAPFPCYRFKSRSTGCAWTTWPRTN